MTRNRIQVCCYSNPNPNPAEKVSIESLMRNLFSPLMFDLPLSKSQQER